MSMMSSTAELEMASADIAPPLSGMFKTGRADVAQKRLSLALKPHKISQSVDESLSFCHQEKSFGSMSFNWLSYGADVTIAAPELEDVYFFQFTLAGECNVSQGGKSLNSNTGSLYVVDPYRPFEKKWQSDCSQLIVVIPKKAVEQVVLQDLGHLPNTSLTFDLADQSTALKGKTLFNLLKVICSDLAMGLPTFNAAAIQKHLETSFLSTIIETMPNSYDAYYQVTPSAVAPHYVHRAAEFISASLDQPISLGDLAVHSGCSTRSLQNGFQKYWGDTPMAFIKKRRLEKARQILVRADAQDTSVTAIAFDCGFNHLSRFSADYKAAYGEAPRATLWKKLS